MSFNRHLFIYTVSDNTARFGPIRLLPLQQMQLNIYNIEPRRTSFSGITVNRVFTYRCAFVFWQYLSKKIWLNNSSVRYLLRIPLTICHLYDRNYYYYIFFFLSLLARKKFNLQVKNCIVPQQKASCIRLLQRLVRVGRVQRVALAEAAREC